MEIAAAESNIVKVYTVKYIVKVLLDYVLVAGDWKKIHNESFEEYEISEVMLNPLAKIKRMSLRIMFNCVLKVTKVMDYLDC